MILVFGQTGQLARALSRLPDVVCLGRDQADLEHPQHCVDAILRLAPAGVINAAAFTDVNRAESDEARATIINGHAPAVMAQTCADLGIPFVHVSTDYVFDGSGDTPFVPTDEIAPLNAYGRSKAVGEQGVRDAGGRFAILRTSWVFSGGGANFLTTMLRLSETRTSLDIVSDQIGGPTPATDLALACMAACRGLVGGTAKSGTYHFAGAPDVSWADFAEHIFDAGDRRVTVNKIPSSAYPTPSVRPLNSRLDCDTFQAAFGVKRPDWRAALPDLVKAALGQT